MNSKVAYITGGSKGIGYGVAKALCKEGYNVAITSRHKSEVEEAAAQLNESSSGSAIGFVSDVRDYEQETATIQKVREHFKQIDIVFANAGIGYFGSIEELTKSQWQDVIDINLTGVFHTIKGSVDALKESKGYFITLASLAGTNFFAGGCAYNASKFGLVGFTQAVMLDLRKYGIKTTTIMPGSVATYFNNHSPNESDSWKIQPEDIGQMVVDLLRLPARTLPSKIELRPTIPPSVKS